MLDNLWPWDKLTFNNIKDKAFSMSESIFPFYEGSMSDYLYGNSWINNDGHRDAFRHSYWNILLARKFGEDWTKRFTIAHEALPENPATREAMDLYNNEAGRTIALENPNADENELSELLRKAINDGKLIVINQLGKLDWSNKQSCTLAAWSNS